MADSSFKMFQPGGTFTGVLGWWASRVINQGSDVLGVGRWSHITLQGRGSRKLVIITAYRVVAVTFTSTSNTTAYAKQ